MAEAIPFGLVQKIIERLGSTAFKEIGSIWGVKGEFENLKNTFSTVQAVLQDAEEKQDTNNQVRDWLMELRDVAYYADDVLSDFTAEDLRRRVMYGDKMAKKVRIFFSNSNQLVYRFKMAHKIKAIRERLDAIANDKNNLQFVEPPLQRRVVARERDQTHSFIRDEEVIGRENEKKIIIDMLLNSDEVENVSFISIVGIGGLGKTTLAQYVYTDERVKAYFELQMWVCVSDVFNVKEIAEKIIEFATVTKPENLDTMEQVRKTLCRELNQNRYLLVLDSVWNENREKWSELKGLLIGGLKGSKVVITTRSKLVAEITSTVSPYFLEGLSKDESWSLFKQIAFGKGQETIDPKLVEVGMDILEKCCGVPLAIKTIGRILYFNKTEDEWSSIKDKKLTNIAQREDDILPILKLSYDNLPSHLKLCFAYCSLFPKDYEIPKLTLIQLWIAHGFIQSSDEQLQLEDVANKYCMDLLWCCFFQEAKEDEFGNIISFKMHDLIHDVAQLVSRFECTYVDSNEVVVNETVCHLSFQIYSDFEKILNSFVKAKKIRSFLIFDYGSLLEASTLKKLISSFRYLCVLDLHGLKIVTMPNNISKLTHLKYLNLSKNDIEVLPNSIIRLVNLQTLKLSSCEKLKELPRDIQKLICLEHLEIDGCYNLTHMPYGIGQLTSLKTLSLFVVSKDLEASSSKHCGGLVELNKLNNLRGELCIKNLAWVIDATSDAKNANLKEKRLLRSLKLSWDSEDNNGTYVSHDENLLKGLQPHQTLKKLNVEGYRGVSFPSWLPLVTSLVELEISKSMCQHLPRLYQLPSLRKLFLKNMTGLKYISDRVITEEFSASTTFFPSLKSFKLWDCPNLKGWWRRDIADAATTSISSEQYQQHIPLPYFPCLSYLNIRDCNNLTCTPLFPDLEENLVLYYTSFKPLQETMAMTMNMSATSSLPSSSSSFPLFSKLKSLTLEGIQDVESLPEELLQNLASLEYLRIWSCPRLKSLPRFMQHLTSLKKLSIGNCKELDLFSEESDDGTQCVTTLQQLKISMDHRLITLPKWIGNVTPLQRLEISDCPNLTSLPEVIGSLSPLQRLEISYCPNLTSLPELIGSLTSLQFLVISDCPKLTSLPEGIGNLTSLQFLVISDCPNLTSLPEGIVNLTSLQDLRIFSFPNLTSIPEGIGNLTSLQDLGIFNFPNLTSIPEGIGNLTSIRELDIYDCPNLNSLPEEIGNLTSLQRLQIEECPNLNSLPEGIGKLTSLYFLIIRNCPLLKERCQEGIGEDWHKIAHIPEFHCWD